jgi:hypothetical protein
MTNMLDDDRLGRISGTEDGTEDVTERRGLVRPHRSASKDMYSYLANLVLYLGS